jgi:DNA invertase Pin-like site-specific DNA recombinase
MQKQTDKTENPNLDNQILLCGNTAAPRLFQRITSNAPMSEQTRAIVRDNILQFQAHNLPQKDEPEGLTACYERLSQEDKNDGESNSIANQKKILERYCKERGYTPFRHYDEDDGYSGTTFNRPGFQRMLADVKAGKIVRVVVKDMSRFGRDYLQVGMYTDVLFPEFGVHFVAVNDGVDSTRGDNEFTAIRNVFNEMYARDTSKKIRATWQSKGKSGEHLCTNPPFGYMKDPEDKKRWIVDEEAAAVVQTIFSYCAGGMGPTQIAKRLHSDGILTPSAYWKTKDVKKPCKPPKDPCKWCNEAVSSILERVEYLGHTVNFKTVKQSYKSKKTLYNDPDNWAIFENTQEAIIEESVFLIVQNLRQYRKRPTKMGDMGMFSGLLYCADCGGKMYQCRANHFKREQEYFICSTYRKDRADCTTHTIRNVVLEEIVLRNLREAIAYVSEREDDFIREAADNTMREQDRELARKKDALTKSEQRIAELDSIIKRLYEDNVTGKLTDERFVKLSREYEREQNKLKAEIETTRREVKERERSRLNVKSFIAATKKYTDLKELDATVLRAFIDRIYISAVDKNVKTREIEIVYNFIGAFDFGAATEQVQNQTRQAKIGIA